MTWKQIEQAREIRQWIVQIIVPAGVTLGLLAANPEIRQFAKDQAVKIKHKIKSKKAQINIIK